MKAGKGSCQPFFCALFSLPLQGMTKAILHIFAALILAVSCSSAGSEAENMRAWYAEGCSLGEEGDHYGAILSLTKAMNCAIRAPRQPCWYLPSWSLSRRGFGSQG